MKKKWVFELGMAIAAGYAVSRVVRIAMATGHSMEPTIKHGQFVIVDRLAKPKKGDLIAFKSRQKKGPKHFLKRIVALEGDVVRINLGRLNLNGFFVEEPYLKEPMRKRRMEAVTVPKGHVFALGDNRNNSLDSRALGTIPLKDVIGVVKYGR